VVCPDCVQQQHELCRGGTWCDCQHRPQPGLKAQLYGSMPVYEDDAKVPITEA
jgi:hypothetical protein